MEKKDIATGLTDPTKLINAIIQSKVDTYVETALEQYDIATHEVMKRPDKPVQKSTGVLDERGKEQYRTKWEPVAKIPLAYQNLIVSQAVSFLVGGGVTIGCTPENEKEENLLAMIQKILDDNKFEFKIDQIAEKTMSELECAAILAFPESEGDYWGDLGYKGSSDVNRNKEPRITIVSPSTGHNIYPVYDTVGRLVAIGIGYTIVVEEKDVQRFDLYEESYIYQYKLGSEWNLIENGEIFHNMGKIPVILFNQKHTEWYTVQHSIDAQEVIGSMHHDSNERAAFPIMLAYGVEDIEMASKGDTGIVLQIKDYTSNQAKIEYLTADNAPESLKLEIENNNENIYVNSGTVKLSFRDVAGLNNLTNLGIEMYFLPAQMKAKRKQIGMFGECMQRLLNLIKAVCVKINTQMEPAKNMKAKFEYKEFRPLNITEAIDNITASINNGTMSKDTGVDLNPQIVDKEAEKAKIKEQADIAEKKDLQLTKNTINPNDNPTNEK